VPGSGMAPVRLITFPRNTSRCISWGLDDLRQEGNNFVMMKLLIGVICWLLLFSSMALGSAHYDIVSTQIGSAPSKEAQITIYFDEKEPPIGFSCREAAQCSCLFEIPVVQDSIAYSYEVRVLANRALEYQIECPISWLYTNIPPGTIFGVGVQPQDLILTNSPLADIAF